MDIRAVAFDANGTLVNILTEDGMEEIFRVTGVTPGPGAEGG